MEFTGTTAAEHETVQRTGWPILTEVQALLSENPGARFDLLRGAGHDASLHHPARAYHLRAIAFWRDPQRRVALFPLHAA
ncbi:MAG TPA: hypothetical protein VF474_05880 [Phenylobacterium sp.]